MTVYSLVTALLTVSLIAGVMVVMPSMIRATLPLGVAVPSAHVDEPAVRRAVRRYRLVVGAAWIVGVVAALALAFRSPAVGAVLPVLLTAAIATLGYAGCRTSILRAKRAGGWYENVSVRVEGAVTPDPPAHPVHAYGWFVAALVVLAATAGVGIAVYPTLPDPVPVHWNGAGQVDGWADKNVGSVFGPLLIGLGIAVLFFAFTFVIRYMPSRTDSSGLRADVQKRYIGGLLGQIILLTALLMAWMQLAAWLLPEATWAFAVGTVGMLVLLALVIVGYVVRVRRTVARARRLVPAGAGVAQDTHDTHEHPDDDSHWVLGVFYVNHEDPAAFVPKRFGIGWTINLGSPIGKSIGIVLLLILVGSLALPLLVPAN